MRGWFFCKRLPRGNHPARRRGTPRPPSLASTGAVPCCSPCRSRQRRLTPLALPSAPGCFQQASDADVALAKFDIPDDCGIVVRCSQFVPDGDFVVAFGSIFLCVLTEMLQNAEAGLPNT